MIPRSIAYHLLLGAAFFAALSGDGLASTYYLDAASGNDAASGQSPALAWQSFGKVNAKTFQPGDQLLLKAGSTWTGRLHPMGSGTASAKITIDRYDSGAKPVIHGGGVAGGAVFLENQQYWSINNLEVTNNGSAEPKKMGILIRNDCVGTLSGIEVRNCDIHDIAGVMTNYIDGKESGGIVFSITISNAAVPSKWTDIVIENNTIRDVIREGILMQSLWINKPQDPNSNWNGLGPYLASTNVRIAGNVLERIGGDGIIPWCVKDSVVEHNFVRASNNNTRGQGHAGVWPYFCENVVFQHNEVCETKTRFDGMAFDFDSSNQNCIYQYNYCHDNEGGFLNMCCDSNANGNIARYNISQNDGCVTGGRVFLVHGDGNHGYQVYNNTIYVKNANPPMFEQGGASNGSDILFRNNLFINLGSGSFNAPGGCTFDGNLYSGNYHIAADARKILANPRLVAPGSGGTGLTSVDGYKLRSGSPALAAGILVSNNGDLDFWGNPVSSSSPPHLGAYNGSAVWIAPIITSGPIPLVNPSLESGGSGWEDPNGSVAFTSWSRSGPAGGSPVAHTGSRGLWNCWGYGWNSLAQQSTYTVGFAGETITASVWAKTSDILVGGAWFNLTLTLDNVGVALVQPNYPANRDWTELTTSYVTTAADIGKTVGISFGTDGGSTNGQPNYVYMDNPGLSVVPPAGAVFDSWINATWPLLTDKTPAGDPDHDGIPNLLEYVLQHGDPSLSSTAILPTANASGNDLVFTFHRRHTSTADTAQTIQYGNDLSGWTEVALTHGGMVSITPDTPAAGIDEVIVTLPKNGNPSQFVRLKVSR